MHYTHHIMNARTSLQKAIAELEASNKPVTISSISYAQEVSQAMCDLEGLIIASAVTFRWDKETVARLFHLTPDEVADIHHRYRSRLKRRVRQKTGLL